MSYEPPKVVQEFHIQIADGDRDKDGKLTPTAVDFLRRVMPDTVHRIAPHVPLGKHINVKITIEGNLV